jgi:hypothetical protein
LGPIPNPQSPIPIDAFINLTNFHKNLSNINIIVVGILFF